MRIARFALLLTHIGMQTESQKGIPRLFVSIGWSDCHHVNFQFFYWLKHQTRHRAGGITKSDDDSQVAE